MYLIYAEVQVVVSWDIEKLKTYDKIGPFLRIFKVPVNRSMCNIEV